MPAADPVERALQAKLAAHLRWGKTTDRTAATEPLRQGRWASLLRRVDEACPGLPDDERARRAESLRKADMAALALASVKARRLRKEAARDAELAEEEALLAASEAVPQ